MAWSINLLEDRNSYDLITKQLEDRYSHGLIYQPIRGQGQPWLDISTYYSRGLSANRKISGTVSSLATSQFSGQLWRLYNFGKLPYCFKIHKKNCRNNNRVLHCICFTVFLVFFTSVHTFYIHIGFFFQQWRTITMQKCGPENNRFRNP